MHLNNSQLLAPNDVEMSHILACNECKNRFDNRLKIQNKLKEVLVEADQKLPQISWREFNSKLGKRRLNTISFLNRNSKKETNSAKKKFLLVAMAASLFVVFGLQINEKRLQVEVMNSEQIITKLIKENQRLVSELYALEKRVNSDSENKMFLEMELVQIDNELQKLYLSSDNDSDKIELWKQRQEVIKRLMATNEHSHVIRI